MTTRKPLLEIQGVAHSYGDVSALKDITLSIEENEFFALLGPSGCGKTTLLRAIAGFETPQFGTITLDGVDLISQPAHKRPLNMMFQSYALFPHMSVEKNIAYGLEAEGLPKSEITQRVSDILDTIGLTRFAGKRPSKLSGGQRQRVALARAIVKRPRLLLLDEPLSALDRQVRAEMQLELKRLQAEVGMTFVVVTHDQEEAMSMADRVAVLNNGVLEQMDTPVNLYEKPATRFVAGFIGSANLWDGLATSKGINMPVMGEISNKHLLPPNTDATLVVRPEDISIVTPGSGVVNGTVVDTYYLGGTSTIAIAVEGLEAPIICKVHAASREQVGDFVGVSIDLARAYIVPRS